MKALVTGSSGFIGSRLVEDLVKRKYNVYCLVRKSSDLKWTKDLDPELVKFITADYEDRESLAAAVKGMDYVFHVGAVIDAREWEPFYRANVEGTVNLLEACAQVNPGLKKFVFVSSIAAAGPAKDKKTKTENDECNPVSLYGKSKLLAEEACARFYDKFPLVILRPTIVLGVRQRQLNSMMQLVSKRIIPMLGNGDKQTSLCFVQDVVQALILAAENETVKSRTFFVADGEAYSYSDMSTRIKKELGLSFVLKIPYPLLMAIAFAVEIVAWITGKNPLISRRRILSARRNYWLHDISRIKEELGFTPKIDFEEGIKDIVKSYKTKERNI
jgi:nucleoside-diphosphate-sugar epimerase